MNFDASAVRKCLKSFDFETLFREHLGWDNHKAELEISISDTVFILNAIAEKRGFVAFVCDTIPDRSTRLKIDHQVTKSAHEHFVIYSDKSAGHQVWHWVRREPGKPRASRDHRFDITQSGDPLIQRLDQIAVSLDEEEAITIVDVAGRAQSAFDVDKVTKKFYERFKKEHTAFQKLIKGIKADSDLQWYTSVMLNRMMFVYFIQKKGFLDSDTDYLRDRLTKVRKIKGKDKFHSFYRYFLLRLFHDGLGKSPDERKLDATLEKLLGKVPFLNGGFFEVHELEAKNPDIDIPDKAFEKLFDFFDQYRWHLDERPRRADNEINPDVVGYIFEKYINQKQMGAYYTKEDITEYISKNTIIPFLFDAAQKKCAIAFKKDSALWRLLKDDPDRYIYPAVRQGVIDDNGDVIPLPKQIKAGVKNVAKRDKWNHPADAPYALPTETWREHVARRERCMEIRDKLSKGEIHKINDLITLNLDIWQFARDVILNSEGPELLRAFWRTIDKITVLDPTCGSGAFLFAALRILETLYSDCLERMERFIEDLAATPGKHHPKQYSDFKMVLAQISKHPSDRYFILKSIIISNLFGVDIMEEAVEICKLRLFLKLVAQVESVSQIEPLPDIDFNIRAGNTLVGYTTLDQVRKSQEGVLGFGEKVIQRLEEDAETVDRAFQQFHTQQTINGGKVTSKDKQELRKRLAKLGAELDGYLAGEYGLSADRYRSKISYEKAFAKWKTSHEPFHWFVEFYGIMNSGGFNVIIGNPPYVEYSNVKQTYTIRGYSTENCGNLYAFVWERCVDIASEAGGIGMIQPVAAVCTDGYRPLRSLLRSTGLSVVSNFNDRPSKLFDGLEHIRLCIVLQRKGMLHRTFSTTYNKWQSVERPHLFQVLSFIDSTNLYLDDAMAKVGSAIETSILERLQAEKGSLGDYECDGRWAIYYTRKLSSFVQILDFVPAMKDARGHKREPSELKKITFASQDHRDVFLSILNSSLFYWLLTVYSDCRNLNKRDIGFARFDFARSTKTELKQFGELCAMLMADIRANSRMSTMTYKDLGALQIQCTYPKFSKNIIDGIDGALRQHYGLTEDESDFIINYDIKYRVGADGVNED
jgi:hypothetical protein